MRFQPAFHQALIDSREGFNEERPALIFNRIGLQVVGCVVEHEGKILLCRRGIEPCKGMWTIPAGFMELKESTAGEFFIKTGCKALISCSPIPISDSCCSAEGAERETWEEAHAHVNILAPYFHLDIPVIGQSYVLFRSKLASPFTFGCGPETLEARLFDPSDIPFDEVRSLHHLSPRVVA